MSTVQRLITDFPITIFSGAQDIRQSSNFDWLCVSSICLFAMNTIPLNVCEVHQFNVDTNPKYGIELFLYFALSRGS